MHYTNFDPCQYLDLCQYLICWHSGVFDVIWLHTTNANIWQFTGASNLLPSSLYQMHNIANCCYLYASIW